MTSKPAPAEAVLDESDMCRCEHSRAFHRPSRRGECTVGFPEASTAERCACRRFEEPEADAPSQSTEAAAVKPCGTTDGHHFYRCDMCDAVLDTPLAGLLEVTARPEPPVEGALEGGE